MNAFRKRLLLGSSALTGLTGIGYWWMDTMLEPMNEWAVINHPLQPWMLKAHIVVAPVMAVDWQEVVSLDVTPRGEGGFGHTGTTGKGLPQP